MRMLTTLFVLPAQSARRVRVRNRRKKKIHVIAANAAGKPLCHFGTHTRIFMQNLQKP